MVSPTFSLTDTLIRGRQTNSQVIVSGVPFRLEKKMGRLIAGYCSPKKTISSQGFLGERLNNLHSWRHCDVIGSIIYSQLRFWHHWFNMTKILFKFGQQQLVMVNYACGLNQSGTEKYLEWIITIFLSGASINISVSTTVDTQSSVYRVMTNILITYVGGCSLIDGG